MVFKVVSEPQGTLGGPLVYLRGMPHFPKPSNSPGKRP